MTEEVKTHSFFSYNYVCNKSATDSCPQGLEPQVSASGAQVFTIWWCDLLHLL